MAGRVTFFPVDNGDMVLIKLDDQRQTTVLIDMNIRKAAENEADPACDVNKELRDRLELDSDDRPYVDVFVTSHPDQDHCLGAERHLHLALVSDYVDNPTEGEKKIVVKELWSSPRVFRRASLAEPLCDDAKAISREARRRVAAFKNSGNTSISAMPEGDRIRIIGEDDDGKTDEILEIVSLVDTEFSVINGQDEGFAKMTVLAPLSPDEIDGGDETLSKNDSSVIIQYQLHPKHTAGLDRGYCLYLTGGDAAVAIWDRLCDKHEPGFKPLQYDLLLSPHHCSWRSLSHDSWKDKGENAEVSLKARAALGQRREPTKAYIVASSKPIRKDDDNPPHERAKREYIDILEGEEGNFFCTGEYPIEDATEPLEFIITDNGFEPPARKAPSVVGTAAAAGATSTPIPHG